MAFHILSTLFAALAGTVIYFRWPRRRRQLLFGALFSLPIIGYELISAGRFERLGVNLVGAWEYVVLTTIEVMSIGGVLAVVADTTINRWLSPNIHLRRHSLVWVFVGLGVAAVLTMFGWSLGPAFVVGLAVNAILIFLLDRRLLWDALVGGAAFGAWYAVADVLFGIRSSGDIQSLMLGSNPIGLTLLGLPLERVLIGFMAGALLGPLFTATKNLRATNLPQTTDVPRPKVIFGIIVTALGLLAIGTVSYAFVVPPSMVSLQPANGSTVTVTTSAIVIHFSRPVDRDEISLTINPRVDGTWQFEQPTVSDHGFLRAKFVFDAVLQPGTTYHGAISNIHSVWGLSGKDVPFQFTIPPAPVVAAPVPVAPVPVVVIPPVVPPPTPAAPIATPVAVAPTQHIMAIPQDYQDSPLSCEAAALKMALNGVGVKVTERQIMSVVGYDPTPYAGNVWGDPNVAFVGNIAGKQDVSGYGVYWGPIARAANQWHPAHVITDSTPEQIAAAVYADHPVVIWGTLGHAYRDDWKTPKGKTILAWKGEHARTVIGVIGPVDHPISFIINDPVVGRITWSRSALIANWKAFDYSGVVLD